MSIALLLLGQFYELQVERDRLNAAEVAGTLLLSEKEEALTNSEWPNYQGLIRCRIM